MRQKGSAPGAIARTSIRRGAEIFGLGLLFRVQEFVLGRPWAPWTDLLRVDVLNVIGISLMLMGVVELAGAQRARRIWRWRRSSLRDCDADAAAVDHLAAAMAAVVSRVVHQRRAQFKSPQPWLFPIFPWTAFAFAGLAVGFLLFSDWAIEKPGARDGSIRRGGRGTVLFFIVARRAARAALRGVRLLAHEPEFFPGARGDSAGDFVGRVRVVPLGAGANRHSAR